MKLFCCTKHCCLLPSGEFLYWHRGIFSLSGSSRVGVISKKQRKGEETVESLNEGIILTTRNTAMERIDPKTRNERKGKGGKGSHKTIYNQKSIRIQEKLREKNSEKKKPFER
jgi:hypothetical protein